MDDKSETVIQVFVGSHNNVNTAVFLVTKKPKSVLDSNLMSGNDPFNITLFIFTKKRKSNVLINN